MQKYSKHLNKYSNHIEEGHLHLNRISVELFKTYIRSIQEILKIYLMHIGEGFKKD